MRGAENKQTSRDDIRRDGTPSIESLNYHRMMSGASGRVESGSGEREREEREEEMGFRKYCTSSTYKYST